MSAKFTKTCHRMGQSLLWPKLLLFLITSTLQAAVLVQGKSLFGQWSETTSSGDDTSGSSNTRISFETASFDDIHNSLPHLTPNQLSILINHRGAAAAVMKSSSEGIHSNIINSQNHLFKFDYNISKLLYSMGDSCFVEVWKYFQPDDHVQNNEPFSIAIMDFVSRYFGFELSRWLSFTVQLETIRDQRIQKYMGLGLRDSQISGSSNSFYEPRNLLNDLISSAGNSDVFSRRKSICQRVLMFAGDNFKASIEKMPSLFSCATVKEITQFFADGTQSTKRLKLVREQIGSLSLLQKDALVRQLNQVQNTFVKWRTTTEEVDCDLSEFDFFQTTHSSSRRSERWTLLNGGGKNLIKLPYLARVQKTEPHAKWATLLWQLFSEEKMRDAMSAFFQHELQQVMPQISDELCSQFTLYQRALLSKVLEAFFKTNPLDQTGWSKEEQERFSCFLKLDAQPKANNEVTGNIIRNLDNDSFYNLRTNVGSGMNAQMIAPVKNSPGQEWDSINSLDRIFEVLFFNSSQIRSRSEAVQVVRAIRREFLRSHGSALNSISELSRHQLNAIPAFVLREFWTSEFNFNSGRNFELCRESFIRVGSIDNSDLSPRKRAKLVNIFMDKCKNVFEDNLRVLNSLVCDWSSLLLPPLSSMTSSQEVLREQNKKQQWVSRSRDCRITNEAFAASLWEQFQNDSLQDLLFNLGPNNLCTVVRTHYWNEVAIDANHFDRLLWTLLKIDEKISHAIFRGAKEKEKMGKCLQKVVSKLKTSMEKKMEMFKYDSTIPCQHLLIFKELNKYLPDDLLVGAATSTNKNERIVDEYYSCLNLIGSHHDWFSVTQLIKFVTEIETQHWQVFTTRERIDSPKLDGLVVFWKLSNLIPYLNSTSIKSILQQSQAQTGTSTVHQKASPQHQQETILAFLSNLKWKVMSENSEAARQVLEHFGLFLHSKTAEQKLVALKNIVCSLPNYQSAEDLQQLLSTMHYCTEEGELKKSGVIFQRNLAGSYLLMSSQNVQLRQTIHGKVVNVDQLPESLLKTSIRQIVAKSLDEISIEQASYLLSEMNESDWSLDQRERLLAIVDSGEVIEEKEEETDLKSGKNGEERANNGDATEKDKQKIDFSYSEGSEGATMIRSVEIIYITASTNKLQLTNFLIILTSPLLRTVIICLLT